MDGDTSDVDIGQDKKQSASAEGVAIADATGCGQEEGPRMSTGSVSVVDDSPCLQYGATDTHRVHDGASGCGRGESSMIGDYDMSSRMSAGLKEGTTQHLKGISASPVTEPGCTDIGSPNQNGVRASTSKQRQDFMTRPRETKASQLRTNSRSATEINLPQRDGVRRQSSLKSEKMTTLRLNSLKDSSPNRLPSCSTSSDDNSDIMESKSDAGSDGNSDPKSRDHWNRQSQPGAQQSPAAARHEFPESQHGPSVLAAKTQPALAAIGLKLKSDVSQQNQNKSKSQVSSSPYGPTEKYLTPLQQKERQNKELNVYIAKLEQLVQDQDDRIQKFEDEKQEALDEVRKAKDKEMGKLLIEIKKLHMQHQQTECSLAEVAEQLVDERKVTTSMKEQIETMKKEQEERESVHQQRYLDMYQKGREAQLIDQEEDLICMAIATAPGGDGKSKSLVKKLEQTEQELEKLRQTFREDVYHKSPVLDTDSAAQVEILKSAVYYYLTDTQPVVNLNVMLSMLNYSDVQKRNIISHLKKKSK